MFKEPLTLLHGKSTMNAKSVLHIFNIQQYIVATPFCAQYVHILYTIHPPNKFTRPFPTFCCLRNKTSAAQ